MADIRIDPANPNAIAITEDPVVRSVSLDSLYQQLNQANAQLQNMQKAINNQQKKVNDLVGVISIAVTAGAKTEAQIAIDEAEPVQLSSPPADSAPQ